MGEALRIDVRQRLARHEVAAILTLIGDATDTDGVAPLSEHVRLHLRRGGDVQDYNLLAWSGDELAGYAHLDPTDAVEGASGEVVVASAHRGSGIGTALVTKLEELGDTGRLRLWAHGMHPAAERLARRMGFERIRALWQMRRSLYVPLPPVELPPDISVRTFVPGQDEEEWIRVNNAAFRDHPDQGRWTVEDLRMREAESWFDPRGFFLAERDGELVAFHWTKVHGVLDHDHDHDGGHHEHDPIGEVYVVGVHPSVQGQRLGPAMTLVGLHHLRGRGLGEAMLYVDEANTNAIRVYERLGFTRYDTDVLFRRAAG